jgi:hypothetical protein
MGEVRMVFGGVMMQSTRVSEVARVIVGISLFALVIGLWVCLWVPPLSIF